ncbi:MAG: S-layer homology domain-containing protein, partial [Chloroflexia bacterium]
YDLYEHFGVANGNQSAPSGPPIMRKLRMGANGTLELSNDGTATPGPNTGSERASKPDAPGINTCLPAPSTSYTIFPHWDDLRTDCQGCGIFTNITGTIGSRILDIEWRGDYYLCGGHVDFELRLYESTGEFDVIYGQVDQSGSQTTVGVQRDPENFTQFSCNTVGSINPGMMLHFTRQTCGAATNTPTSTVTGTPPTSTATLIPVVVCVQPPPPTSTPCPITFIDVQQGSTFYDNIRCLACRGVVNGYPVGTFRPQNNVTRGQLSKIVSNSAGFSNPAGTQIFEDILPGSTFYDFVQRLASRGYIGGYPCGGAGEPCVPPTNRPYFRPNNNASRGQISKIVSNAAGFSNPAGTQIFEDVLPGSTFYDFVQRLASRGYIGGYPCGGTGEPCVPPTNRSYFRPNNNATRGQTSKIVANTFFPGCATPNRSEIH